MKLSSKALININNSDYTTVQQILEFNFGLEKANEVVESYGSYSDKSQWADSLDSDIVEILEVGFK